MTAPQIRPACDDDVAPLARLARDTFCETFVGGFAVGYPDHDLNAFLEASYTPQKVSLWIKDPNAQVLVAQEGGRLIAYAHAGDNDLPYEQARPGDGELKRIYVARSAQGTGLGRGLLERSFAWLGARPIYIGVWSGNHKAQRLYRRYGFKIVGGYQFAVGGSLDDEVIMGRLEGSVQNPA